MMGRAQGMVNEHVEDRKVVRHEVGFMNTKKTGNFAAQTLRAQEKEQQRVSVRQSRTQLVGGMDVGEVKALQVKTANKTIRVMRQEAALKRE